MILKLHQKEVIKAQKEFGEEFLVMMKQNPKVKELLIKECQQQKFGDYYVRTQDFLNQLSVDFPDNSQMNIQLANRLKRLTELEKTNPIIFMPSAETKEEGTISLFSTLHDFEVLVPDFENPAPNDSYPGYVLDNQNQLVYYQQVNEEFAWEYDVIVIGFEEDLPLESMTAGPDDNLEKPDYRPIVPNIFRTPGREEWGGIIQVTNMGAIEPWISGKFEFAYYVISNGIKIHEREFGKYKRTHFKDQKWFNFNNKIGYWNISNWGNMQIEGWRELDGGNSASITVSWPASQGLPGTTITIPSENRDDDLGSQSVQFTDPCLPEPNVTTYNISHMNFRRETKN